MVQKGLDWKGTIISMYWNSFVMLYQTRLKLNSVLDREPENYSNLPSFSNHSNLAF